MKSRCKQLLGLCLVLMSLCVNIRIIAEDAATVTLPSQLLTIEDQAFSGNAMFENVVLPEGMTTIGSMAFSECTGLKTIYIPDSVTQIANDAFSGCGNITFRSSEGSYAAQYASSHSNIGLVPPGEISVTLTALNSMADASAFSVDWRLETSYKMAGDRYIFREYLNGNLYSENPWNVNFDGDNAGLSIILNTESYVQQETGEYYAIVDYHHADGSTTQAISGKTQIVGPLNASLYAADTTINRCEYVTWMLDTDQVAGSALVQYFIYRDDELYAQSGYVTTPSYRVQPMDAGTYTAQAIVTDGLGREITVQGNAVMVSEGENASEPLTYRLSEDGQSYIITDCDLSATEVIVPVERNGLPVSTVAYGAFMACENLISVQLPDSIKSVEAYAFHGCKNLLEVTLPSSDTAMGEGVFSHCISLENIPFPSSMERIPAYYAQGCESLTSISFPSAITSVGEKAFSGCKGLQSLSFNAPVEHIGADAFANCSTLTTLAFPTGMTAVNASAFLGCTGLVTILLPETIETIEERAFAGCISLPTIVLPESVTSIETSAFAGCTSLTTVKIENIDAQLADRVFDYCANVEVQTFGSGAVERWADAAGVNFRNTALPEVTHAEMITYNPTAGRSVTWQAQANWGIEPYTYEFNVYCGDELQAASGCSSSSSFCHIPNKEGVYYAVVTVTDAMGLQASGQTDLIEVKPGTEGTLEYLTYELINNGTAYAITRITGIPAQETKIVIPEEIDDIPVVEIAAQASYSITNSKYISSITIPDSVTTIGAWAFSSLSGLQEFIMGDGVKEIGNYAFSNCYALQKIALPSSLRTIGTEAFSSCTALEEIKMPYGVTTIKYGAFYKCTALTSITVPSSVTACEGSVFLACSQLREAEWNAQIDVLPPDLFNQCTNLETVRINYPITEIFGSFDKSGLINLEGRLEKLTYIHSGAFSYCNRLTSIEFPAKADVIIIGDGAFVGCTNLESVKLWENAVCSLDGRSSFAECSSLKELRCRYIQMDEHPYSTYTHASFDGCTSLKEVTVYGDIKDYSFRNCTSLETVNFIDVSTIGNQAFRYCSNLKTLTFRSTPGRENYTLAVNSWAFENCTSLTEVTFPCAYSSGAVTNLGISDSAFLGCTSLKRVNLPQYEYPGYTSIQDAAFKDCTALETVGNSGYVDLIEKQAFKNCISLKAFEMTNPYSAEVASGYYKAIYEEAFANCISLTTLTFDASDNRIIHAFPGCKNLTIFTVPGSATEEYLTKYPDDMVTYASLELTPSLSMELEWGAVDPLNSTIEAKITVYNAKGKTIIKAGNWENEVAAAQLKNLRLTASSNCLYPTYEDGSTESPYVLGDLGYASSISTTIKLRCMANKPSTHSHAKLNFSIATDSGTSCGLTDSASSIKFSGVTDGDLIIRSATTLSTDTIVTGDVYVYNALTVNGVKLNCHGNVYICEGGTIKTRGESRIYAQELDIQAGGAVDLEGSTFVDVNSLKNNGSLAFLSSLGKVKTDSFSVTGSGILNMVNNGEITTDRFLFDTSASHTSLLSNGIINARHAELRQGFYAHGDHAFVLTGETCTLNVARSSPLQEFSVLVIDCEIGNLTVQNISALLGLPFKCTHFGLSKGSIEKEVKKSNDVAKEIYDKFTTAKLEELTEAEEELAKAMEGWYSVTLNVGNLSTGTLKTAQKATTFAEKAVLHWALDTMKEAPSKWSSVNDILNSILTTNTGAAYTYEDFGAKYDMEVRPLGGLSVTSASVSAGRVICKTAGQTFEYTYFLSREGIRKNGEVLLKVLRKYGEEEFVKYLNKAVEEALGKENSKYALAVVKVVETSLIEEKMLLEVIADKYGKDIAKKLITKLFPQLKKTIDFMTKWEKYIKQTDKVNTMITQTRNGDALPTDLMQEFIKLEKLVP